MSLKNYLLRKTSYHTLNWKKYAKNDTVCRFKADKGKKFLRNESKYVLLSLTIIIHYSIKYVLK